MNKMDQIWVATATLIYPNIECTYLVSGSQIIEQIKAMFNADITPVMLNAHLVSFIDRHANVQNQNRGGSRNRYLFRTIDGNTPNSNGDFRLFKSRDQQYDGWDKTGKTCPTMEDIDKNYYYLINWYNQEYLNSECEA